MKRIASKSCILCILAVGLMCGIGIGIDGPDTITKYEAEKQISRTIFWKAAGCGYNGARAFAIRNLGNASDSSDYPSITPRDRSKQIYYEVRAVDHCLEALGVMPCPAPGVATPNGKAYQDAYDNDFIVLVIVTRALHCVFEGVRLLKFKEPDLERFC